ncbi:unnamed protein product [Didymodactylos carnosus]|uniref:FYVE-type domain-containing protein n=1 Tax=Didymodactylos carnosus TaxID=1234261 RepID=A0A814L854_9BILA|nr:unnamed protein product [Didymodactylos carnosus]CAF1059863.1 unnamed protein product [Didymodactylos carnosus]CAF3503827.1 unnamed protein product [Didymodactylos carnosus]CAF3828347.1 unnamed protein product [Didymodactylos carnosus]
METPGSQSKIRALSKKKTNIIHDQYTKSNDIQYENGMNSDVVDDSNVNLQIFFSRLEQLLLVDLKNRKSLLGNKNKTYWDFFVLVLKDSKGLYDGVLYVLNCQEVKTSVGRGRLFIRFCLQNHRLGDVIQQSFMINKAVSQFYTPECLWSNPLYTHRIIQAIYQLNDIKFDLLDSRTIYELDVSWPSLESRTRSRTISDAMRHRTNSISSFLSMESVISSSVPIGEDEFLTSIPKCDLDLSSFQQLADASLNGGSSAQSVSSNEEINDGSSSYWKQRCHQLELELDQTQQQHEQQQQIFQSDELDQNNSTKEMIDSPTQTDINISEDEMKVYEQEKQKLIDNYESQLTTLNEKYEKIKSYSVTLSDEITSLNFQLSSVSIQRSSTTDEYEREISNFRSLLESKDFMLKSLQDQHEIQMNSQKSNLKQLEEKQSQILSENNEKLEKTLQELAEKAYEISKQKLSQELEEKTNNLNQSRLDFDEMKRRLIKAIREKAELWDEKHSYELKLVEEQAKVWIPDEDALNCSKCGTAFGWTVRKHHCRMCYKIYCYYCSNNFTSGSTPNTRYRICDVCNEKVLSESLKPTPIDNTEIIDIDEYDNINVNFEVRSEKIASNISTHAEETPP